MRGLYPVSLACEVLELSVSGYFNWLRRRESDQGGPARRQSDEALLAHMRVIHAEVKGEYDWPRMHKELLARGIRVGKGHWVGFKLAYAGGESGLDRIEICEYVIGEAVFSNRLPQMLGRIQLGTVGRQHE